jgi:hypothetical protein
MQKPVDLTVPEIILQKTKTVALTVPEIFRLQYCSICDKDKGFYVCQSEKCLNKDKLLYCDKCGKDNHKHGAVRIQNL